MAFYQAGFAKIHQKWIEFYSIKFYFNCNIMLTLIGTKTKF